MDTVTLKMSVYDKRTKEYINPAKPAVSTADGNNVFRYAPTATIKRDKSTLYMRIPYWRNGCPGSYMNQSVRLRKVYPLYDDNGKINGFTNHGLYHVYMFKLPDEAKKHHSTNEEVTNFVSNLLKGDS